MKYPFNKSVILNKEKNLFTPTLRTQILRFAQDDKSFYRRFCLMFLLLFCFISIHAQKDSIITRSTLYGIGHTNLLDTYLSPMEYTGPELRILRENMRMTKHMDGKVSRQSLFQANVSLTENKVGTGSEFSVLANWNLAYHNQFPISQNLTLMAGPNLDLN